MTEFQEMKQQKEYFEKQYEETLSQYNQMGEAVSSLQNFPSNFLQYFNRIRILNVRYMYMYMYIVMNLIFEF